MRTMQGAPTAVSVVFPSSGASGFSSRMSERQLFAVVGDLQHIVNRRVNTAVLYLFLRALGKPFNGFLAARRV